MSSLRLSVSCLMLAAAATACAAAEWKRGEPLKRYTAQWADGTVLTADEVGPWNAVAAKPKLGDRELLDENRPARWLIDNTLPAARQPEAVVEFFGGDSLPGRATAFHDGTEIPGRRLPPNLEVVLPLRLEAPEGGPKSTLFVSTAWVRRIVWQRVTERYQPGNVFLYDGRQLDFRSARFNDRGLRLLRREGVFDVAFPEIAELHMPVQEPWEAYYEQLAALGLAENERLMRWETDWGLRLTTTMERFRAAKRGDDKPSNWYHLAQPAWALEPFWLPFESVRVREFYRPSEVPLSRIEPAAGSQQSQWAGSAWGWLADRNVLGDAMENAGLCTPFGIGVHGQSELEFPLPAFAVAFQTRLGLDRAAGSGGCARAKVFLNAAAGNPLYSSNVLVGSTDRHDSGRIALGAGGPTPAKLILQVDPAHGERPSGADPLDIRDVFDWIEPIVEVDPEKLRAEVTRRGPRMVPAWQSWKVVMGDDEAVPLQSQWDGSERSGSSFRLFATCGTDLLRLSGRLFVRPYQDQLVLVVAKPSGGPTTRIEVRIDGLPIGDYEVPQRSSTRESQIVVSLARYHNRQVDVELIQESKAGRAMVDWRDITLVGRADVEDLASGRWKWNAASKRVPRERPRRGR